MQNSVEYELRNWERERREPKIGWAGAERWAEVTEHNEEWAERGAEGRRAGTERGVAIAKNIVERWAAILTLMLCFYALLIVSSDIIYVFNLHNLIITS